MPQHVCARSSEHKGEKCKSKPHGDVKTECKFWFVGGWWATSVKRMCSYCVDIDIA